MKTAIPGLIIRKTELGDLHNIYMLGLEEQSFNSMINSWDAAVLADVFSSSGVVSFTAVRKKETAGFIIGTVCGNDAEILWILVKEKFRKRGIGSQLLDMLSEKTKKSGVTNFFVALFPDRTETETFFIRRSIIQRESFIRLSGKL